MRKAATKMTTSVENLETSRIVGSKWPDDKLSPLLCVPAHLERTLPGLQLVREHLIAEGRTASAVVLGDAYDALVWMSQQIHLVIEGNGVLSLPEERR